MSEILTPNDDLWQRTALNSKTKSSLILQNKKFHTELNQNISKTLSDFTKSKTQWV
jgi:hypothetical protein